MTKETQEKWKAASMTYKHTKPTITIILDINYENKTAKATTITTITVTKNAKQRTNFTKITGNCALPPTLNPKHLCSHFSAALLRASTPLTTHRISTFVVLQQLTFAC